jgi:hypothetical protein
VGCDSIIRGFKSRRSPYLRRNKKKETITGVEGFEPANGGVKVRCLTTWRHPNFN